MAKKKTVDLSERLNRQSRTVEAIRQDPSVETSITVTLDELIPSEFNPRQKENPKYEDIKESIKARGLDHKFNVTRQSCDDPYQVADGGNTRLQALKELYEETQEERFFKHQVTFKPWVDDEEALAGHLVENDLRGDICLIERALSAKRWIDLINAKEDKPLSMRKVSERMKAKGWRIDHSNLSVLLYAADNLLPFIPTLLWTGAGKPVVKKIRSYENAFKAYWDSLIENGEEPTEAWDTIWEEALTEFDDIAFDFDDFFQRLSLRFSTAVNEPMSAVSAEVFNIMHGEKPSGVKSPQPTHNQINEEEKPPASTSANTPAKAPAAPVTANETPAQSPQTPEVTPPIETITSHQDKVALAPSLIENNDIEALLEHSYNTMFELLVPLQLDHYLMPTYGNNNYPPGVGWVIELADQPLSEIEKKITPLQEVWLYSAWIPALSFIMEAHQRKKTEAKVFLQQSLPLKWQDLLEASPMIHAFIHMNMVRQAPTDIEANKPLALSTTKLRELELTFTHIRRHFNDDLIAMFTIQNK